MKPKKEPEKKLAAVLVKDTETNRILYRFPPTESGVKRANRFTGLIGIEIIKEYTFEEGS